MSKRDYYEVLEVSRTSTEVEIKTAYRKKALQYHPDKNPGDHSAEEKFKEASEAYEILSHPEKKQIYDRYGHAGFQGGMGGGGGFSNMEDIFDSFGDIFEDLFGGGGRRGRSRNMARRGSDLQYELEIDFLEACFGCEKNVAIPRTTLCQECHGSGGKNPDSIKTCSRCNGMGQVAHSQGFFTMATTCPTCRGQGKVIAEACEECRGQGRVRETKKLNVKVPAGIDNGIRLVLQGEGEAGENGGPAGSLYVLIHVKEHDQFARDEDNIRSQIKINMVTAALGGTLPVATIDGEETLEIKSGLQSGTEVRIKGKGVQNVRGGSRRGDHIVTVIVETPTHLTSRQKELLIEFNGGVVEADKTSEKKKSKKKGIFG